MPGAQAVHSRLYRSRGAAKHFACVACGAPARDWAYQYTAGDSERVSSSGQRFSDSTDDYAPMCRKCHVEFDAVRDPAQKERRDRASRSVSREVRKRAGDTFARRLKTDEGFSKEMEVIRSRAVRLGGAATAERFKNDPLFREERSASLRQAALRRYTCLECGYTNNAGTVARHQKRLNHEGREVPDAR